jgi:nitric oxide reductase subunit B
MGTTIGINTTILFASAYYIVTLEDKEYLYRYLKIIRIGFWIFNISLGIFWICLLLGGVEKSIWMYFSDVPTTFGEMQTKILPYMYVFLVAGFGIFIGIIFVAIPLLRVLINRINNY